MLNDRNRVLNIHYPVALKLMETFHSAFRVFQGTHPQFQFLFVGGVWVLCEREFSIDRSQYMVWLAVTLWQKFAKRDRIITKNFTWRRDVRFRSVVKPCVRQHIITLSIRWNVDASASRPVVWCVFKMLVKDLPSPGSCTRMPSTP